MGRVSVVDVGPGGTARVLQRRVCAVVVNYFSHADVAALVPRLVEEGVHRVVVVDNSCADVEWDALAALASQHPRVTAVRAAANRGFAAGVNEGVSTAGPLGDDDCLWLVNPDTSPEPGSLGALVDAVCDDLAEIVSPLITTGPARDVIWFAGGDLDLRVGDSRHRGQGLALSEMVPDVRQCTFVTGAAMLLTVRAWRRLGGLREHYFLYWEDADLSHRAAQAGLRMALVPRAVLWHQVGGSDPSSGMSADYYFYMQRNRAWLMREVSGRRRSVLGPGLRFSVKNVAIPLVKERHGRWRKAGAAVRGLVAGLVQMPPSAVSTRRAGEGSR